MIFFRIFTPLGFDFRVYWEAAWMILRGLNPYQGIISSTFPFNYPPTALLFLWPLGFLPQNLAAILWNLASVSALLLSIFLVIKITKTKYVWSSFFIFTFLFTLPYFPSKFNLGMGQINNFVLVLVAAALFFYTSGRKNLSALCLAIATGIKLAPAVFILYFFLKKDWRQVFRVGIFLLTIIFVSFILVPVSYQIEYFSKVLPLSFTLGSKDWYYNQSLYGFLARLLSNGFVVQLAFYGLSILILFLTWWRGRRVSNFRQIATVACLYLLIHPIALQHYFGLALIPVILLTLGSARGNWRNWGVLGISYLLLAANIKQPELVPREFNFLLSHQFFGILLLWILALWRERIMRVIGGIWVIGVTTGYLLMLLCRAGICF